MGRMGRVGTSNVRSFGISGKLSNVMKILNCYVFAVLNFGCEGWTWNKAMRKKVNACEYWCYKRILKISWRDRVKMRWS